MKDFSKKLLVPACVYFTFITFVYAIFNYIAYGSGEGSGLDSVRMILFFVFSLIFSTANALLLSGSLAKPIRVIIHAVLTGFGFWLCMIRPIESTTGVKLVGLLLFYVVYAVVLVVVSVIGSSRRKRANRKADYRSIISGDTDKK